MLGSQSWYTALAVPTIVIGGFVATRKRLAYQWREELMDPEGTAYPAATDADMEFFRRVAPASAVEAAEALASPLQKQRMRRTGSSQDASALVAAAEDALGVALGAKDNIGVNVYSNVLPPEMRNVLLNEVQRWSQTLGNPLDARKVDAIEAHLAVAVASDSRSAVAPVEDGASAPAPPAAEEAKDTTASSSSTWLDFSFLRHTRLIADHAEDIQPMKAPWGSGDRMRMAEMPASLRHLVHRTQQSYQGMGRLRHVYIEYSPSGRFYRAPRPPKMYDGHDYVILPLRRDGGDTVVTMSPILRSRASDLREVARHSWTNRDVDALVPAGCMLRVYGTARYEWGWGMRPGSTWFGSRLNRIHAPSGGNSTHREGPAAQGWRGMLQRMVSPLWQPRTGPSESGNRALSAPASSASADAALIVLHFEGPRASNKQRSLLLQPEIWIFGRPPSVETFETWYEDRPTADSVQQEGVVWFMIRNYFDMLTVS